MIDREDDRVEELYRRAGAALRSPAEGDDHARDRMVRAIHAESSRRPLASPVTLLPWWTALAAAGIAFVVGLGAGRVSSNSPSSSRHAAVGAADSGQRAVEFVFVAPTARNVSLVGDFNGWDASATPMRRMDGRTTWSVAVQLPAGRHVYAFVIDGDAWVADPQAPIAPEQWFGQRNSVVVVSPTDRRS
jgi:Carbohydrate-binding module 48 (Isoamylase N-terminal domain)